MEPRYQYRQRVYSESQDTSPERHTSRPNNHLRYIGKFPIALPAYDVVVRKPLSRESSELSKGRKCSTELKKQDQIALDINDIDSTQVNITLQKQDKSQIEAKRSKIAYRLIEKNFLPDIDKVGAMVDEQTKRGLPKEGYTAGNSKMLQKVHKLFCNQFHNQRKEILRPQAQMPRGTAQANTSSNSKYRKACFFDNPPLPQPPPSYHPITTAHRYQQQLNPLKSESKSAQNTVQLISKPNAKKAAELDPLDFGSAASRMSNLCRKPLTHQDRKRHKTLESKQSHPIELFTFYPSKKRIDTQSIDNEFL